MKYLLATALLFLNACAPSPHPTNKNVEATLLAEPTSVQPGAVFSVGLRLKMKPAWHTYWKNPGDAGLPLNITWTLPAGFTAGPIEWPAPQRIEANGIVSYGYHDDVLLPVKIQAPATIDGRSVKIHGDFQWLECADICVPGGDTLEITLPVKAAAPSPSRWAPAFAASRARMPKAPTGWSFAAAAGDSTIALDFTPPGGVEAGGATFFPDTSFVTEYAEPQRFERVSKGGYRLTMVPAVNAPSPPTRLAGVLEVAGPSASSGVAVQIDVPIVRGVARAKPTP